MRQKYSNPIQQLKPEFSQGRNARISRRQIQLNYSAQIFCNFLQTVKTILQKVSKSMRVCISSGKCRIEGGGKLIVVKLVLGRHLGFLAKLNRGHDAMAASMKWKWKWGGQHGGCRWNLHLLHSFLHPSKQKQICMQREGIFCYFIFLNFICTNKNGSFKREGLEIGHSDFSLDAITCVEFVLMLIK